MLGNGGNPNSPDLGGWTPLHIAAKYGFLDSIRKLLDHGANPLLATKTSNWTPLHCALDAWKLEAAKLLLSPQSDKSLMKRGRTVLHEAVTLMDEDFIKNILSLGLDINVTDDEGWTSYHEACDLREEEDALRMIQLLHSNGADVNACTSRETSR